jgi:hypothetical protein
MNQPDRQKIIYPALVLGLTTAAFIIAKTGRDALFFQGKGIFQLPVATKMLVTASLSIFEPPCNFCASSCVKVIAVLLRPLPGRYNGDKS